VFLVPTSALGVFPSGVVTGPSAALSPACAGATSAWCGTEGPSPVPVAGIDDLYPSNAANHCFDVVNGLGDSGCVVGSIAPTAVTLSETTGAAGSIAATLLCSTTNCPAGTYRVSIYIDMTTACGTSGTVIPWVGYTDDNGARAGSSATTFFPINGIGSAPATGTLTTTTATNFAQGTYTLRTTGAATGGLGSINYGTTQTVCGSGGPMAGKMYLTVERIGTI
jgi:hypothetical protein